MASRPPRDLVPWWVAYRWFATWSADETWARIHDVPRKRHLPVDTNGLVLKDVVRSASLQDRHGAKQVLTGITERYPRLGLVWVDGGYVNSVDTSLVGWAATENIEMVAVPRNADVRGFQVLPRRWSLPPRTGGRSGFPPSAQAASTIRPAPELTLT